MSSAPDVRVVETPGEPVVIFGPWEAWEGNYTAMKLADLKDLIEKLWRTPVE